MWLTWRTKEGSWTAFEHENKKPLVALILYDDAFKCFQCIWVLEWAPFITLLWHPFLSGSHFPLCSTSKHLRESGLRSFDSISCCCLFFFTHQRDKQKTGEECWNSYVIRNWFQRWTSIMNQAEGQILLKPANSPSRGPRHQSLLVWSSRTCHSCRSMSARPNGPTILWIHPRWKFSISSSRVFSNDSPTKPHPVSHSEIQLEPLHNLPPRHLLPRQSHLPHIWTFDKCPTQSGNTEALPSWASWRLILRLTDDWSHRPSPYASRLEAVGGCSKRWVREEDANNRHVPKNFNRKYQEATAIIIYIYTYKCSTCW